MGQPAKAGIIFGVASILAVLMAKSVFRSLSFEADLSPLDVYDILSFQFDFMFLGLGALFGAFIEWLRRRSSSWQYAMAARNDAEMEFHTVTFVALMLTILLIVLTLFLADRWGLALPSTFDGWDLSYTPRWLVFVRLIVFNLIGAGVLFVCGAAALKAPH